jgi:hypothetical protein
LFDSIEQLEQQVAEFQKNILASSALVINIKELTSTIKNQQKDFLREVDEILVRIDQDRRFTKEQVDMMLTSMDQRAAAVSLDVVKTNSELINRIQENFTEYDNRLINSLEKSELENITISEDALNAYRKLNQEYIEKLQNTSIHISNLKEQLDLQFTQFSDKLESTSIGKLNEHIQKVEKSLKNKIRILIAGVSVTALLALLSLILE